MSSVAGDPDRTVYLPPLQTYVPEGGHLHISQGHSCLTSRCDDEVSRDGLRSSGKLAVMEQHPMSIDTDSTPLEHE